MMATDAERLDWLESVMRPADGYVEVYLAGLRCGNGPATSFQVELHGIDSIQGASLREAIDKAMKGKQPDSAGEI